MEEAAWAGHSDHMKAVKHDLKWHEEAMLDVSLFLIISISAVLFVLYWLLRLVIGLVYRRVLRPVARYMGLDWAKFKGQVINSLEMKDRKYD